MASTLLFESALGASALSKWAATYVTAILIVLAAVCLSQPRPKRIPERAPRLRARSSAPRARAHASGGAYPSTYSANPAQDDWGEVSGVRTPEEARKRVRALHAAAVRAWDLEVAHAASVAPRRGLALDVGGGGGSCRPALLRPFRLDDSARAIVRAICGMRGAEDDHTDLLPPLGSTVRPLRPGIRDCPFHLRDAWSMRPGAQLTDQAIDSYMALIAAHADAVALAAPPAAAVPAHVFGMAFWKQLHWNDGEYDFGRMRRTLERLQRASGGRSPLDGSLDAVIFPVHIDAHWVLGVINFARRRLEYYDSNGGAHRALVIAGLGRLLADERERVGRRLDLEVEGWTERTSPPDLPQQGSTLDCGVYMCQAALALVRGIGLHYDHADAADLRERMVYELLRGALLPLPGSSAIIA
jgi:hypothetical protein